MGETGNPNPNPNPNPKTLTLKHQLLPQVLGDVVKQSGYVIISNVLTPPKEEEWWSLLSADVNSLKDTNNCVSIFNGLAKKNDHNRQQILFSV